MSLLDDFKSAGIIKSVTVAESEFFTPKDLIQTHVPIINVALSGTLDGGLSPGILSIGGPSRHFKSNLGLVVVSTFMKKHPNGICLFYDSEFGTTPEYLHSHGIDTTRMLHLPITSVEILKNDLVGKLEKIKDGDEIIIFIDSVGNLASSKEINDSLEDKNTADMTRSKVLKSMYRMITPSLNLKKIPCVIVQHTYETMEMFSKQVMSGGTGGMLSSNIVWFVGRAQEKQGTDLVGYNFTINIEKSRFVREKSKLPFQVTFEHGINKWGGLLDLAIESGHIIKPSNGRYQKAKSKDDKKYFEKETNSKEFWEEILDDKLFYDFVKHKYQLSSAPFKVE